MTLALSDPEWIAVIFAGAAFVILALTSGHNRLKWFSRKRYSPEFEGPWAEGTILNHFDQKTGQVVKQVPCVYLTVKIRPGARAIHNCEVWFANKAWLAQFDTVGYDRYDVLREEHVHVGRFEVDLGAGTVVFYRPIHIALALQRAGGWRGEQYDIRSGPLTTDVDGEVDGEPLHRRIVLSVDVASLLRNVQWQEAWRKEKPDLVESASQVIRSYVETLGDPAASRPKEHTSGKPFEGL